MLYHSKINLLLLVIWCSMLTLNVQAQNVSNKVYVESKMYGHSETSSIKQIVFDEFEGKNFSGGEKSFTHNSWEVGTVFKGLKFASLARYDYSLYYTEDVAGLVYAEKNDLPIETNRTYDLDLSVLHARTYGFKFGYEWMVTPGIKLGADVSALKLASYMEGGLNGQVFVGEDDYDGQISLDYVYSKDKLLDRITPRPSGYGYALDVRMEVQHQNLSFLAELNDVASQLNIERSPFTKANANSNGVTLSETGQIDRKPILSGNEGYREHTLRLPKRALLEGRYRITEEYESGVRFSRYDQWVYTSLLLAKFLPSGEQIQSAIDFRTSAVTLGWKNKDWSISLTVDHFDLTEARTFGLSFSWN